ncbi:MAG: DUF2911 domain-containing protein [Saprospiraceae bacterium]|nr:DUF2911 domain-containing protein [Saprospiraceae bacterium]
MKKVFLSIAIAAMTALSIHTLEAQIRTPAASPSAELKQTVGLTEVTINYSRPSAKGRVVFGDLVPMNELWRTGANAATKLTFGDNVKVAGKELKKGSYAIITAPGQDGWKVMLHMYESTNWGSYAEKEPFAAFVIRPDRTAEFTETFTIAINDITTTTASIDIRWENTKISIPLEVEVDTRVQDDIKRVMAGPSAGDYSAAASYYHDNGKDLNQALEWIQKANASTPRYWTLRREAQILGDLKRYDEAIKVAEKSSALASESGDDAYVRMNKKSIEEWSKMKGKTNK